MRFYGGSPWHWLAEVPQGVVGAHLEMMPRLQAEEAKTATMVAVMGRSMKAGGWIRRLWAAWKRAALGRGTPARTATPADLGSMGIAYRPVKRNG